MSVRAMAWTVVVLLVTLGAARAEVPPGRIPLLYSTDLFHPHADPDDHYDLATLLAIEAFDVKGIVLDLGATQAERPGRPAVEQMRHITGRRVPYAVGLRRPLRSRDDKALDEPAGFQGGVRLILSVLREANEKVTLFTTGSCRDVAAALNREPALLREKVRAVYFNVGRGPGEAQNECNVDYDRAAYLRLFESGLPLYWCPCFGRDGYATHYVADQETVVGACVPAVRNFFVYCLTKSPTDAVAFLSSGPHSLPRGPRSMWCTAPLLHAAGWQVYRRGPDDYAAMSPEAARRADLAGKTVEAFTFVPMRATLAAGPEASASPLRVATNPPEPNGLVFRATDPQYGRIMASCLRNLLAGLGQ